MNPEELLINALLTCTLPKSEWTHEAHVRFGVAMVRRHGAVRALRLLRAAIRSYNEATGVANTESSGYHETLTCYYTAVAASLVERGTSIDEMLLDPLNERDAPLRFWDADTLFSPLARARWVEPERPLSFPVPWVARPTPDRSAVS